MTAAKPPTKIKVTTYEKSYTVRAEDFVMEALGDHVVVTLLDKNRLAVAAFVDPESVYFEV